MSEEERNVPAAKPKKKSETSFNPEMHIDPDRFEISFDGQPSGQHRIRHLYIELREGFKGRRWCIRMQEWNLTKRGRWEYERMPSSRTEKFLERARYNSVAEALEYIEKYKAKVLAVLGIPGAGPWPKLRIG